MLETIRRQIQSRTAKVVLLLLIVSFAFAGVSSYLQAGGPEVAIQVGDAEITEARVTQALEQAKQQYGEQYAVIFDTPIKQQLFKRQVKERLVNDTLIKAAAARYQLAADDSTVKQAIQAVAEFQREGQFAPDLYHSTLKMYGIQPAQFEASKRQEIVRSQLAGSLMASAFSVPTLVEQYAAVDGQKRDFDYVNIPYTHFEADIKIDSAAVGEYFAANAAKFMTKPMARFEWIDLSVEAIAQTIEIDPVAVRAFYDENQSQFTSPESRQIAHILVEGDDQAAAEKIASIEAELKAGASFSDLAKTHSDDTFSAENGGDLGVFSSGTFEPEFDEAVLSLSKVGDVTAVVQTIYGYHLIKLTDLQSSQVQAFDVVAPKILTRLQQTEAREQYFDLQVALDEARFDQPDSLEAASSATGLPVQTSAWRLVGGAPFKSDAENQANAFDDIYAIPAVQQVAFSDNLVKDGQNSDLIEVNEDRSIVIRVLEYKAAAPQTLEAVEADIRAMLIKEAAVEKALAVREEIISAARDNQDVREIATKYGLKLVNIQDSDRRNVELPYNILQTAFKAKLPESGVAVEAVERQGGDHAVVLLKAVRTPENVSNEDLVLPNARLQNIARQASIAQFVDALRAATKVVYFDDGIQAE